MNVLFLSLHDVTRAIFIVFRSCSCLGSSIWRVICFSVYCYSKYAFTWRNQLAPGWCGCNSTWWRHQMGTFSALLAFCEGSPPVTGEFPSQRPVTRSFDVFFDPRLNKRLSKQWRHWWFESPSRSLWRHCNESLFANALRVLFVRKLDIYCTIHFMWMSLELTDKWSLFLLMNWSHTK